MNNAVEKLVPPLKLQECTVCMRHFSSDRIKAHETVCQKTSGIIRKSFTDSQQSIQGTEAEKFANVVPKNKNCKWGLATNWRGKHEDFLKRVKHAKEISNRKNSKANDLPFSPVDESDYIQCQYCLRKFNSASAARHIIICASRMCPRKSGTENEKPNGKPKMSLAESSNAASSQISLIRN